MKFISIQYAQKRKKKKNPLSPSWGVQLNPGSDPLQVNTSFGISQTPYSTVSGTSPSTSELTPALGSLSHTTRLQDPALPASSLELTPSPGFSRHWVGNSPGVSWTLCPPGRQRKPWGFLGFCRQLPCDPGPLSSNQQPLHKARPGNQADRWSTTPPRPPA